MCVRVTRKGKRQRKRRRETKFFLWCQQTPTQASLFLAHKQSTTKIYIALPWLRYFFLFLFLFLEKRRKAKGRGGDRHTAPAPHQDAQAFATLSAATAQSKANTPRHGSLRAGRYYLTMEKAAGLPQISVQPYQHNSADTESLSWLHTGTSGGKKKASAALSPCVAGGAVLPLTPPLSADTHLSSSFDFAKLPAKSGKKSTPVPSIVGRECEREPAALLHTEKEPDSQQLRAEPPHPRPSLPDIDEMVRAHGESPTKPPYAIVCLVTMALGTAPNYKRTASEINDWVAARFAFYRNAPSRSWRFSLRHKLSVSSYFQRLEKNTHSKHKGCFWTIKPEHLEDVFKVIPRTCVCLFLFPCVCFCV